MLNNRDYTRDGNGVPFGGQGAPRPPVIGSNGKPFGGWVQLNRFIKLWEDNILCYTPSTKTK